MLVLSDIDAGDERLLNWARYATRAGNEARVECHRQALVIMSNVR